MNIKKLAYFIFIVSAFIFLFSMLNFFLRQTVLQTNEVYTSVNVSNRGGFNLNKTALTFGEVPVGGSSSWRTIDIDNGFAFPISAKISCEGIICEILNFEKVVKLEKGEKKKITFSVITIQDTKKGFYDGKIKVQFKRRYTL